jgi:hypothetical protein
MEERTENGWSELVVTDSGAKSVALGAKENVAMAGKVDEEKLGVDIITVRDGEDGTWWTREARLGKFTCNPHLRAVCAFRNDLRIKGSQLEKIKYRRKNHRHRRGTSSTSKHVCDQRRAGWLRLGGVHDLQDRGQGRAGRGGVG